MEHRPLDHPLVQSSSQRWIDGPLDEQAQGHQVDADGLDRPQVVAVGMLNGVCVDNDLMEGHAGGIRVLRRQQFAIAVPAAGRTRHVRMSGAVNGRQQCLTARADFWAINVDHRLIVSLNGPAKPVIWPLKPPTPAPMEDPPAGQRRPAVAGLPLRAEAIG